MKNDLRLLAALLIVTVGLWIPVMRGPIDLRWDAGVYYILGTSLAQGQGYRILSEPGDPQAVIYPPLLPLVVAGHQLLLGTSDPVVVGKLLRVTFELMLLAAVAVIYVLARRWLSPWQAFTVGIIYLLSRETYFLASLCFAEVPFTLVTLLFFLPQRPGWRKEIGTGACAIAAFLLRTIGIALIAAWVADSLIQRQWKRAALRAAVGLLPVLLWQGYVNLVKASDGYKDPAYAYQRATYQYYNVPYSENMEYLDPFRPELGKATLAQRLERVANNLGPIIQSFGAAVSWRGLALGEVASWRRQLLDFGVSVFVILGLVVLWRCGERLMILYLILSILIIAATPWPAQFARYFSPLVPFLAMGFVQGIVSAKQQFSRHVDQKRLVSVGFTLVAGLWVVSALTLKLLDYARPDGNATYVDASGVKHPYRLFYYDNGWRDFDAALNWLRGYTLPGAVVASSAPHFVYLMVHSKAVMPPMESDVNTAQGLLDSVPVTFLIVDDLEFLDVSKRYVQPVLTAYGDRWKKVYTVPGTGTAVYQRTDASSSGGAPVHP